MSLLAAAALVAIGIGVGILIGAVGIGGVVLVPLLTFGFGVEVRAAVGASLFAFVFSGMAATALCWRSGITHRRLMWAVVVGTAPGAYAGAAALADLSPTIVLLLVSLLMIAAGVNAIAGPGRPERGTAPGPGLIGVLSIGVGFLSAITGTGGAVVLVPLLLILGVAPLPAVILGQFAQLPIAALASLRNIAAGQIDWPAAIVLATCLPGGVWLGLRAAGMLPAKRLRRILAMLLIGLGGFVGLRTLLA